MPKRNLFIVSPLPMANCRPLPSPFCPLSSDSHFPQSKTQNQTSKIKNLKSPPSHFPTFSPSHHFRLLDRWRKDRSTSPMNPTSNIQNPKSSAHIRTFPLSHLSTSIPPSTAHRAFRSRSHSRTSPQAREVWSVGGLSSVLHRPFLSPIYNLLS